MKKAQISMFLIVALLIFIIIILIFSAYSGKGIVLTFDRASIQNYVTNCIKTTGEEGLTLLGKQGGKIKLKEYISMDNLKVEYGLFNNTINFPTKEGMENELDLFMESNLNDCLQNFSEFKRQGWEVQKEKILSHTSINENDVTFEASYPFLVSRKDSTLSFDRFSANANVRLKKIIDLANSALSLNINYPQSVDRTSLSDFDFNITVFPYQKSLIYAIYDPQSTILTKPYRFNLALQFLSPQ